MCEVQNGIARQIPESGEVIFLLAGADVTSHTFVSPDACHIQGWILFLTTDYNHHESEK